MSETKCACPVCNKLFAASEITQHVEECLNMSSDIPDQSDTAPPSKKRKCAATSLCSSASASAGANVASGSGWGFLMSGKQDDCGANSKKLRLDKKSSSKIVSKSDLRSKSDVIDLSLSDENSEVAENAGMSQNQSGEKLNAIQSQSTEKVHYTNSLTDFSVPLADQMRPETLENYLGQEKALGNDKMLHKLLIGGSIPSMILWGPPGCGKTTLAKIISKNCKEKTKFVQLSATSSGVNDVKDVVKRAKNDLKMFHKRTILFLDEIHRFNKLQQDSLLPHVEDGTITLIGATTENPSFQVNSALLSRSRVVVLEKHSKTSILNILMGAVNRLDIKVIEENEEKELSQSQEQRVCIESTALDYLSAVCDGDARAALNGLQMTIQSAVSQSKQSNKSCDNTSHDTDEKNDCVVITRDHVKEGLQRSHVAYDKTGEEHYNMISALHKSMRGSDDSAALYWLARMMEGGEDPLYIARRLIEFASDDVGLADPQALILAVNTFQACHFIGKTESEKPLAECVIYLARAPKSYEAMMAYSKAKACIHDHDGPLPPVPLHLRNASTKLMKNLGYGKGYSHNPNVKQEFFPQELIGTNFFK
ncbi:Werner helicase interacting protein 1 [Mactra antiquata]